MSVYLEEESIYKEEDVYLEANFDIKKTRDDQHVFGWASIAKNADGSIPLDWSGDILDIETVEKAAYEFCLNWRGTGEEHQGSAKGAMIESICFTKEKMEALGIPEGTVPEGWWIGFHVPDPEIFAKIKSGHYKMFSIQGQGKRLPIL